MTKRVLVTGDVALDINMYNGRRDKPWSPKGPGTQMAGVPGGAFLLHRVLEAAARPAGDQTGEPEFEVALGLDEGLADRLPTEYRGYTLWEGRPSLDDEKTKVWRLTRALGYGGGHAPGGLFQEFVEQTKGDADIIVLDDGDLGFRLVTASKAWPASLLPDAETGPEWIIHKMADPLCEGDLWRTIQLKHGARTVLIADIEDIRKEEVRVTAGISWERTAQDLVCELQKNPALSSLQAVRYLVVRIGLEGALVVERDGDRPAVYTLIFDPSSMEGDWRAKVKGSAIGFMTCLTVAVARGLVLSSSRDAVISAVKQGIAAMRALLSVGHGVIGGKEGPTFPFDTVSAALRDAETAKGFAHAEVPPRGASADAEWSILESHGIGHFFGAARRLALLGPGELHGVPYQRFGKLLTMDRSEIESLRNLRQLVQDYIALDKGSKPLSLAVFGPPGSGKSFGIKQIAKGILGKEVPLPEFNLSQFKDPRDLIGALHQVRDLVLKGTTPVVFWDEFDSEGYRWLQYLLAPMQDGAFQEGQVTHPIGKCIFVFAGATSWDYTNFGPVEHGQTKEEKEAWERFRLLKGPDFMSRLSGYLNVLGPNQRCTYDRSSSRWVPDPSDTCFPVRRAILMRAMLGVDDDAPLVIDRGILSAFLEIPEYRHGARSLEKILGQLKDRGVRGVLRRSDLPPAEILSLHADHDVFLKIAERDLTFVAKAEDLAPAIHAFYMGHMQEKGHETDLAAEFLDLDAATQADNIAAARRMTSILSLVGLYLVPRDRATPEPAGVIERILEDNMKILAPAEHDGWMDFKLRNGWKLHETRNNASRQHNRLVAYADLPSHEQEKDWSSIRAYPAIAAMAGYCIVTEVPRT